MPEVNQYSRAFSHSVMMLFTTIVVFSQQSAATTSEKPYTIVGDRKALLLLAKYLKDDYRPSSKKAELYQYHAFSITDNRYLKNGNLDSAALYSDRDRLLVQWAHAVRDFNSMPEIKDAALRNIRDDVKDAFNEIVANTNELDALPTPRNYLDGFFAKVLFATSSGSSLFNMANSVLPSKVSIGLDGVSVARDTELSKKAMDQLNSMIEKYFQENEKQAKLADDVRVHQRKIIFALAKLTFCRRELVLLVRKFITSSSGIASSINLDVHSPWMSPGPSFLNINNSSNDTIDESAIFINIHNKDGSETQRIYYIENWSGGTSYIDDLLKNSDSVEGVSDTDGYHQRVQAWLLTGLDSTRVVDYKYQTYRQNDLNYYADGLTIKARMKEESPIRHLVFTFVGKDIHRITRGSLTVQFLPINQSHKRSNKRTNSTTIQLDQWDEAQPIELLLPDDLTEIKKLSVRIEIPSSQKNNPIKRVHSISL